MKYKPLLTKDEMEKTINIEVTCVGCGRTTNIRTDNVIYLSMKCPNCGSLGFNRKAIT